MPMLSGWRSALRLLLVPIIQVRQLPSIEIAFGGACGSAKALRVVLPKRSIDFLDCAVWDRGSVDSLSLPVVTSGRYSHPIF